MDFNKLKKNSAKSFQNLAKKLESFDKKSFGVDETIWKPTVDKAGNGFAIIRFLPPPGDEADPIHRYFEHFFQGPGGWYKELSRTTLEEDDPVSEYNSKLWNSTTDDKHPARVQARKQKRKENFVTNIYIVQDKQNPENNGKVKKYIFGPRIAEKIKEAQNPSFPDATPFNPFDLWTGANFKIKIKTIDDQWNYNESGFDICGPLLDDDSKLEAIWKQCYPLHSEYAAPEAFKSYDVLKAKLVKVLKLDEEHHSGHTSPSAGKSQSYNSPVDEADEYNIRKILSDDDEGTPWD